MIQNFLIYDNEVKKIQIYFQVSDGYLTCLFIKV